jgi:putative PEP-CTERM system histidine kinase
MADFTLANIGIVSYLIGGLGFSFLTAFLLVGWRGRIHGATLTLACALNAIWCFAIIAGLLHEIPIGAMVLAETVRDGAWLLFAAYMVAQADDARGGALLRLPAVILPAALVVFVALRMAMPALPGFGADLLVFAVVAMAMSLWALILLEQLFRNAGAEQRWWLKYICLAVAALFAYDFFMYSYSLLGHRVPLPLWNARGAVNALVVPLLVVAVVRNRSGIMGFRISRRAAFHTGALVVCGGYLLVVALGGYFVRNLGGTWGEFLGVLFFAAALLVLLVMLASAQIRARIRVFITKHFFSYKYDYRDEWLGLTQRLNDAGDTQDPYQRSIKAVAHLMDSPAGALWLRREGVYAAVANWNMPRASGRVDPAAPLMAFLRNRLWVVDLQQHENNPGLYDDLPLPQWLYDIPRARMLIPLPQNDGLLGFVLLAVPRAQYRLTWEDLDLLKTTGWQVAGFLSQQENSQALAQARQFEAFNHMTAYLMHDLKNIVAQQSLIVKNAQKHKANPAFIDDMILTVESSVGRMKRLLQQLQNPTADSDSRQRTPVVHVLEEVIDNLRHSEPLPRLDADCADLFVRVDPSRFAAILSHVVSNAQDAAGEEGRVDIRVRTAQSNVRVQVEDNGVGMEPAFVRDYLFRPFYTTKSSRGMGIGAFQAREFIRAAGGDVEIASAPGQGTVFTVVLPLAADSLVTEPEPAREVGA